METGFLNHVHDEEHFSSSFYNQGNVLDDTEHLLFGEMIIPEIIEYDSLWPSNEDTVEYSHGDEKTTKKEEFQKMLYEWQHQLNYMQEPEAIKQIVPLGSQSTQGVSEMFPGSVPASSTPTPCVDPSIDELFPLEMSNKDNTCSEEIRKSREESYCLTEETLTHIQIKTESSNELEKITELNSNSMKENSIDIGVKTAAIKIKQKQNIFDYVYLEKEDDREKEVDVETVGGEEIPLLMAGDLTSLLEQFEATEKVNTVQSPSPSRLSNQTIRDALPVEVINRIKASRENHKKVISVIPAMPNKRPNRGATRMQDAAATLSRNKLLKLVTGGSSGESVQLDHDYCTNGGDTTSSSSRSYCMSDSSEYPSQSSTPDIFMSRLPVRNYDTGSRKDSGLESGENSDEEIVAVGEVKNKIVIKSNAGLKSINLINESGIVIGSGSTLINKNVPMVSVLRKNIKVEKDSDKLNSSVIPVVVDECMSQTIKSEFASSQGEVNSEEVVLKKKKLNLEEYRVRREERERFRSQESSRANSPVTYPTTPVQPDSTTTVGSQEGLTQGKPVMLSVEVQTQTCDFVDLTSSKSSNGYEKSRKIKRNDLNDRSYQSRHASSSSSSSAESDRHRSYSHRRRSSRRRSRSRQRSSASRMWSRSPSSSSCDSQSGSSSRSQSRSRSCDKGKKWRSRSPPRNNRYNSSKDYRERTWRRSRSPLRGASTRVQDFPSQEKVRQVEERRVIYVGRIDEGTTKADLRKRFQQFGPIVDISVHFRERGDNYGFVTFAHKADAYKAVEHGNDDRKLPHYDLCFGGRRAFCKQRYADLDGLATNVHCQYGPPVMQQRSNDSFDLLLNQVKAQLRKRSSV